MAINASLKSAIQERPSALDTLPALGLPAPHKGCSSEWEVQEVVPNGNPVSVVQRTLERLTAASVPSAPPIEHAVIDAGPIHYPSIDSTLVDFSSPAAVETLAATVDGIKEDAGACSSCVICLDGPVEGACIPCGHMAGCMTCLTEIKGKKWGCPVCRADIDQVLRLYAV